MAPGSAKLRRRGRGLDADGRNRRGRDGQRQRAGVVLKRRRRLLPAARYRPQKLQPHGTSLRAEDKRDACAAVSNVGRHFGERAADKGPSRRLSTALLRRVGPLTRFPPKRGAEPPPPDVSRCCGQTATPRGSSLMPRFSGARHDGSLALCARPQRHKASCCKDGGVVAASAASAAVGRLSDSSGGGHAAAAASASAAAVGAGAAASAAATASPAAAELAVWHSTRPC